MQGTWGDFTFAFVVAICLVFLPGIFVGKSLGVKGYLSIAVAPFISVAIIATTAVAFGAIGIPWSITGLFIICVMLIVLSLLVRNILAPTHIFNKIRLSKKNVCKDKSKTTLLNTEIITWKSIALPFSVAIATGAVLFARILYNLQIPNAISQSWDGHYHYNNVARMLDSGDLSSLHMLQLPPNTSFYPAAWHDFVVSVIQVTGVSIPVAANAVTYLFLCFVWPISILAFALVISRNKLFLTTVATVNTLISFFPAMYAWFGILYANIVASSILPAILFIAITFLMRKEFLLWWQCVILGLYSLFALGFSQPNSVFTVYYVVLIILPFAGVHFAKIKYGKHVTFKQKFMWAFIGICASTVIYVVITLFAYTNKLLHVMKFTPQVLPLAYGRKDALFAFIGNTVLVNRNDINTYFWNIPIAILVFLGVAVVLCKKKHIWLIPMWLLFAFINFVGASWPEPYFRSFVSGVYYGEKMRLVSVQAIFMVIFVSFAIIFLMEKFKAVDWKKSKGYCFKTITPIVLILVFIGGNFVPEYSRQFYSINELFALPKNNNDNFWVFSKPELDFMAHTTKKLDKNYTVIGNPLKGATASWFLFGHKNVLYHIMPPTDVNTKIVIRKLNQAGKDKTVCKAVKKLKLKYVYSFSGRCFWDYQCVKEYPGLEKLNENSAFKLIDQDRYGNKLYEITACDL